jgi:hypothetical protein
VIPELVVGGRSVALAAVAGLGAVLLLRTAWALTREPGEADRAGGPADRRGLIMSAALAALAVGVALIAAARLVPDVPLLRLERVVVEPIALVVTLAMVPIAATVAAARDPRRLTIGALAAVAGFFVLWYPNLAALPLPTAFHNSFQGLLPTYLYDFQFPVSTVDRNVAPPALLAPGPLLLAVSLAVVCVGVGYSAWVWRLTEVERRLATETAVPPPGSPPAALRDPPGGG